MQKKGIL